MCTKSKFVLLAILLGIGPPALAKTWQVQVGGVMQGGSYGDYGGGYNTPILAFSPRNLSIDAGDSVTFINLGGAAHNVHADDNSFRCADGCDDQGGNGTPSNGDWTFTRTFSTPGTIAYHCDQHEDMGMTGSIVVNAAASTFKLGGYLSGNWSNPSQGGHGFQFEFTNQADEAIPTQKEMVVIWFVYAPDGQDQNWVYAQGPYDTTEDSVTVPATLFHGPRFPFPLSNYNPADFHGSLGDWGTLTFTFNGCNAGTMSWNSTAAGYGNGSMPITRVTSIAGTTCPP